MARLTEQEMKKQYDGNVIKVFDNHPVRGLELWKTFTSLSDFEHWMEFDRNPRVDVDADQVEVNGHMLLGWDELGDFLN